LFVKVTSLGKDPLPKGTAHINVDHILEMRQLSKFTEIEYARGGIIHVSESVEEILLDIYRQETRVLFHKEKKPEVF
jgi:hypothetical protein